MPCNMIRYVKCCSKIKSTLLLFVLGILLRLCWMKTFSIWNQNLSIERKFLK